MKKTWQQKMADRQGLPKILRLEEQFPCYPAVHKMGANAGDLVVLVNPSEVAAMMEAVPRGKLVTITGICQTLAAKHKVKACCSLTVGIFIMTIANAVEEMRREGKMNDTPYWRTLKADGSLNEKFPGGAEAHKRLLEEEGQVVVQRGKRYMVEDYRKSLHQW